jgi:hypothetical protein
MRTATSLFQGVFLAFVGAFALTVPQLVWAQGQWTKFASGMPGGSLSGWYYDKEFLRDTGARKIFWMLKDLNQPDENDRQSYRFLVQMDCKEKKFRFIQVAGFKEPMAIGEPLGVDSSLGQWVSMAPDTLFAHINGLVCGLKPAATS